MEIGNRKWRKERVGKRKEEKGGKFVEKRSGERRSESGELQGREA